MRRDLFGFLAGVAFVFLLSSVWAHSLEMFFVGTLFASLSAMVWKK